MYPNPIFQKIKMDPTFPVLSEVMMPLNKITAIHCHWHPSIELLHIIKGHITLYIGNTSFKLNAGDLCIINQNEIHYATNDCNGPCEMHYIVLSCDILELDPSSNNYKKYIEPIKKGHITFPNIPPKCYRRDILDLLNKGLSKGYGWELSIQGAFLKLLSHFYHNDDLISDSLQPKEALMSREREILTFFEEHFTQSLSVSQIASEFSLSEDYFYRLFKRIAGQSPIHYIHNLRIQYAKQLLRTTDLSVSTIGERIGYDSTSYFIKMFKKLTDKTPLAYRKHY